MEGQTGRYTEWDDSNMGKDAQYMYREGALGNWIDSYRKDHNPYARKDVVDDTIIEEYFQNINEQDDCFHPYPLFHGNVYNEVEHYLEPPPFYHNEWKDERGRPIQNVHDDVDMVIGVIYNGSRNTKRDNEDVHDYLSWQGSTSTKSSHAWNSWPYYDNF
jgi:hypothetical protein